MTTSDYDTRLDTAFLAEITEVFRRHPEAAKKYTLASREVERRLGVDYTRQYGFSWIEDGRVLTEYRDRDKEPAVVRARLCLKQELRGQELVCVHWIEAVE
ncbi:hypothetical protein ACIQJT_19720 [Streptomyces sp. NPDC091972]|uniref:hypothetical protein n=1 Tax=Streptomyces sp. NPDC091972 TaxID=3366007 RepID=UPI003816FB1F